ncbi:DNA-directed RNA polymerase (plasmid) [Peribacillus frigoritolerans]|uniref:DNA-directed RNA polymerase n=1 Tax=Peribacillus frigoritolerans TaxID=450367 RepID=UPI00222809FC|nr:DNA-directed RNA polymerase [Peribacillus frigoritolerans]UYZ01847.1 DNA-directed RNA polymerase [Peribacillus frigoritolerans]
MKETRAKRIKTPILKNSKPITVRIPTDKYSYEKIKRGFIANFIHSLDAANIHYLVKIILSSPEHKNKKISLYTIHDCFASVNDQMDIVEQLVRKAFANLYFENNYLHELDTCLMGQIKTYCNDVLISETGERTVALTDPKTGKEEVLNIPSLPDFK